MDDDLLEDRRPALQLLLLAYPPADAAEDKKLFTACEQDEPEEMGEFFRPEEFHGSFMGVSWEFHGISPHFPQKTGRVS